MMMNTTEIQKLEEKIQDAIGLSLSTDSKVVVFAPDIDRTIGIIYEMEGVTDLDSQEEAEWAVAVWGDINGSPFNLLLFTERT